MKDIINSIIKNASNISPASISQNIKEYILENNINLVQDKLDRIYNEQKILSDRIRKNNNKFPTKLKDRIFMITYAIQNECTEIQNLLNWKWWRKQENIIDVEELRKEWTDITHFFIEGAIELGMTPKDILEYYLSKNNINHERIENKY